MNPFIRQALEKLYGANGAAEASSAIAVLIERFASNGGELGGHSRDQRLSERDVVLICYPDQVREPDKRPLQALTGFAAQYFKNSLSGLHLLPFYPWSTDDGFSVKDYTAVDAAFGTWDDIAALGRDFDLMFDAVINHASVQGEWFQKFMAGDQTYRDFFVTVAGDPDLSQVVRPRTHPLLTEFMTAAGPRRVWTTFSSDQVDLNFKNPAVLLTILEVLLLYVRKGARFIRLDAIAFLWKEIGTSCLHRPQTHIIVQLFRAVLDEVAPHVRLITETNVPHADNISYFGDGRNEAQLVYNFALPPLVLHSLQAGDARKLTHSAKSLPVPSKQVTFFNFLASHDGIGLNPARGILNDAEIATMVARTLDQGGFVSSKKMPDESEAPYELNINFLDAVSPASIGEPVELTTRKFLTTQAIMLCLQGVPGIYFHSLVGSRGDVAGVQASGVKRRINREKLDRRRLEKELAECSSLRARIYEGYTALLQKRRAQPAFAPTASQQVLEIDPRVFAVLRNASSNSPPVLCLHNISRELVVLPSGAAIPKRLVLEPFSFGWFVDGELI